MAVNMLCTSQLIFIYYGIQSCTNFKYFILSLIINFHIKVGNSVSDNSIEKKKHNLVVSNECRLGSGAVPTGVAAVQQYRPGRRGP